MTITMHGHVSCLVHQDSINCVDITQLLCMKDNRILYFVKPVSLKKCCNTETVLMSFLDCQIQPDGVTLISMSGLTVTLNYPIRHNSEGVTKLKSEMPLGFLCIISCKNNQLIHRLKNKLNYHIFKIFILQKSNQLQKYNLTFQVLFFSSDPGEMLWP